MHVNDALSWHWSRPCKMNIEGTDTFADEVYVELFEVNGNFSLGR